MLYENRERCELGLCLARKRLHFQQRRSFRPVRIQTYVGYVGFVPQLYVRQVVSEYANKRFAGA